MTELTTTQIQDHFGIKLTADFITNTLQVPPSRIDKRAQFWTADQVGEIGQALIEHIAHRPPLAAESQSNDDLFG